MTPVQTLYTVSGMALVTFLIRYILLPLSGRLRLSVKMQQVLGYVPPAVLTAIIVPMVLMPDNQTLNLSLKNAYLVGAVTTVIIGWISKNLLVTIVGGMGGFLTWQWFLSMGWF
jgi:branched-subunit amino acid transport protein